VDISIGLAGLSLAIWIVLLFFRNGFWLSDQRIGEVGELEFWPAVISVIPARNEVETIGETVRSLLAQDYPGELQIIVVDDGSNDGTAAAVAESSRVHVIPGRPLVEGWSGKLWAVSQGLDAINKVMPEASYVLFTDADIYHAPGNLARLVYKAEKDDKHLVSLMVKLRLESFWELWLIPAFIFFFQKIYPFSAVNNVKNKTAAAAGGCMLVSRNCLKKMGGISEIGSHLIDDCALATLIKSNYPIWLGLSTRTRSLRSYNDLSDIWNLVARSAFVQLNYSVVSLIIAILGMVLIYLVPPVAIVSGIYLNSGYLAIFGLLGWVAMFTAYAPTLLLYQLSPLRGIALPLVAGLYSLMTISSALRYWKGEGCLWKGRYYNSVSEKNTNR
tara:strand:- start:1292 stop:2452 length:1161 start_codon:yes stop_codon:yes gene_type:complete